MRKINSEEIREEFVNILKNEFPLIKCKEITLETGNTRYSLFVLNKKKNKRWIQLDANPEYLSIAMDHFVGDIKIEDLKNLDLSYGLDSSNNAIQIQKNDNAINISIFSNESYNFRREEFIAFLHKHYESYLRLVNVKIN